MKILLLVDCYLPSEKSAARLACDLAQEFVQQGNQVTVLTPSYAIQQGVTEEEDAGVHIIRFKVGKIKNTNLFTRACNEMTLSLVAWYHCRRLLLQKPCDLVLFYSPSIFFGPLVAWMKWKWQAKTYLILRDIFPDWAVHTGVLKKGMVYYLFKAFESIQYYVADTIGVETNSAVDYFQTSRHKNKIEVLRIWARPHPVPKSTGCYRKQFGLDGKLVFFYGGNIGVAQDMDNILRLARRMQENPEAHFLLVGNGSEVERLQRMIENENLANVTIQDAVDQESYFSMLTEFDVGVISLDRRLKSSNYPGKLLGYLQSSLPILASINPGNDLASLLNESGAGMAMINGEDERLFENAIRLFDNSLRETMGKKAHELLNNEFHVEKIASQIIKHIEER